MTRWAVVENPTPYKKPELPEGCVVVNYAAVGDSNGRREWLIVRVAGSAALDALRNWENGMPIKHADCTGEFTLVEFTRTGAAWKCSVCGDTWVATYGDEDDDFTLVDVPVFRTRREALEHANEEVDSRWYASLR